MNHKDFETDIAALMNSVEADAIAKKEARAEEERLAVEFVGDFLGKLCNLPIVLRANGIKVAMYQTLFGVAQNLAISGKEDEGDVEPWETFGSKLASGDLPLFDGNHEAFRKVIIDAFQAVVRHPDFSYVVLAQAIRERQAGDQVRRLRLKAGLRALGIR